jgi:hypothetical protein
MAGRDALLIYSSDYIDNRLRSVVTPVAEIEGLAAVLGDPELGAFNVTRLVNREIQEVRVAIARFCQNRQRDDVVLIHYSGHGIKDENGRLFLGLKDTEVDILSATGLGTRFLLEEFSYNRSRSNVLILDCNYSGAVLTEVTLAREIAILTAAGPVEFTFFEEQDNEGLPRWKGAFTAGLIEGLRTGDADLDGDGTVTFDELFLHAKGAVERATNGRQTPRMFSLTQKPVIAGRAARPIFLSYSRSDADFTAALSDALHTTGHKIWMDTEGISGGEDWRERIGNAIDESKLVLAVLSPEAFNSSWVRRELSYADNVKKPILPVVYKACEIPAWYELQFGHIQRLDLTAQANAVEAEPLLSSIKEVLRSKSPYR